MEEWDTHREEMDPSHGESLDNEEGVEEKKKRKRGRKESKLMGVQRLKATIMK
tara:strand:- start:490 stop:648 length:159 start_codon:yes stop_codon:yes gene_type:complete